MRYGCIVLVWMALVSGCATPGGGEKTESGAEAPKDEKHLATGSIEVPTKLAGGPAGTLEIDVTNVLGKNLAARVDLQDASGHVVLRTYAPKGQLTSEAPVGKFRAFVYAYESDVPILADARDVEVKPGETAYVAVSIIEGSGGKLGLVDFDFDGDFALDRVEIECGTKADDASSIPGKALLPAENRVLAEGRRWYKGELCAQSNYGIGKESVKQLVARAESAGLDFLAITDRNTLGAIFDPDFHSEKLVLIPAMAWGNDAMGNALIYGPKTAPDAPESVYQAQSECLRVQAQGGVFAVAHPCSAEHPWKWGLSYVNAIQAWYGDWGAPPPLKLEMLDEATKVRGTDGKLLYTLAAAAALDTGKVVMEVGSGQTSDAPPEENMAEGAAPATGRVVEIPVQGVSANMQNTYFWDLELVRGLMACGIAGTGTAAPGTPMGRPVTYIQAESQSLPALIEGLRQGRTVMASAPDSVFIDMVADVGLDGTVNARIGDIVPLHKDVRFLVQVTNGQGKKLRILHNGRPIQTKIIDRNDFSWPLKQCPDAQSSYRACVIDNPAESGKSAKPAGVLAMTSPIYAQDLTLDIMQDKLRKMVDVKALNAPIATP